MRKYVFIAYNICKIEDKNNAYGINLHELRRA